MLLKSCIQYVSIFRRLSSGQRAGKGQFSFQSQRRAMPKNVQTTMQLCSFHMLVRLCSKSFKLGFSSTWTEDFQMYKLGLEKAEKAEIKLPTSAGSWKKQESCKKTSISALLAMLTLLCRSQQTGKFLKRWKYQITLPVSWETCMQVKKQLLELHMEQRTGSKLGKEYKKALYIVSLLI